MNDNKIKSINGVMGKDTLLGVLQKLQKDGIIAFASQDFRVGHSNCSEKQFYAPFYIEFNNGEGWLIFTTNSIRNDRMCIQQWNAEHIKAITSHVKRAYVVVPNGIKENPREAKEVERYNEKIVTKRIQSYIDRVLLVDEFVEQVIDYASHY